MEQVRVQVSDRIELYGNLGGLIDGLVRIREGVPEEYLDTLMIEITARERYGDCFVETEIYYFRPQTPEEARRDEARAATEKNVAKARELEMLRHLKEKYEPSQS